MDIVAIVIVALIALGGTAAALFSGSSSPATGADPTAGNTDSSNADIFGPLGSAPGGGNLDANAIAALAQNAGFAGDDLVTAVAVALAESNGNPNAYNPEKAADAPQGKGSYGLWQIFLRAHPEFSSWNLYDPAQNAAAAFKVYSDAGSTFRPWATFTSGAYLARMDAAQGAVSA